MLEQILQTWNWKMGRIVVFEGRQGIYGFWLVFEEWPGCTIVKCFSLDSFSLEVSMWCSVRHEKCTVTEQVSVIPAWHVQEKGITPFLITHILYLFGAMLKMYHCMVRLYGSQFLCSGQAKRNMSGTRRDADKKKRNSGQNEGLIYCVCKRNTSGMLYLRMKISGQNIFLFYLRQCCIDVFRKPTGFIQCPYAHGVSSFEITATLFL